MIEIFSSDDCPLCKEQLSLLNSLGLPFTIVKIGSSEFNNHELKEFAQIIPFIAVKSDEGHFTYARQGFHNADEIQTAVKSAIPPFNLKKARSKKS